MISTRSGVNRKKNKSKFFKDLIKERFLFLLILPAVLYVFIFNYAPMPGIIIAFKDYIYNKGIGGSDWIGFKNFMFFINSGALLRTTKNTILYNLLFIAFDLIFQLGIAVILSEIRGKYFKKVSQTLLLMPYFISWVVTGAMVYNILGTDYGIVNSILQLHGRSKMPFMNTPSIWPFILIFFRVWKNLGYGSVVYLAAITGLDQEIYEAAEIDGANTYQRIFKITLPLIKPTIMIMLMLHLSKIIKGDFQMFYNLTGNNPMLYDVTDVIDTYVYRCLIQSKNFAMSGAAGMYQSVLGFVIIVSINAIIRKIQPDYALF